MEHRAFIEFLNKIEKLKCNTRHSWTSTGRQESVAEHSWRLAVMAMLCEDEYPDLNISKVIYKSSPLPLGTVLEQSIKSGDAVREGSKITISVSG